MFNKNMININVGKHKIKQTRRKHIFYQISTKIYKNNYKNEKKS